MPVRSLLVSGVQLERAYGAGGIMKKKTKRGRPIKNTMPEPIPDTAENIARALLTTPPKDEGDWDYLKDTR